MSTPQLEALHFVECYALHFPASDAINVAARLALAMTQTSIIYVKTIGQLADDMTILEIRNEKAPSIVYETWLDSYREATSSVVPAQIVRLRTINRKIWDLIDLVMADKHTRPQAREIQTLNQSRNDLVRSINNDQPDIGAKVYSE